MFFYTYCERAQGLVKLELKSTLDGHSRSDWKRSNLCARCLDPKFIRV